jgi:hypothetical protein
MLVYWSKHALYWGIKHVQELTHAPLVSRPQAVFQNYLDDNHELYARYIISITALHGYIPVHKVGVTEFANHA